MSSHWIMEGVIILIGKNARFDLATPGQPNHLRLRIVNKLSGSIKTGGGWSDVPLCPGYNKSVKNTYSGTPHGDFVFFFS